MADCACISSDIVVMLHFESLTCEEKLSSKIKKNQCLLLWNCTSLVTTANNFDIVA